MMTSRLASPRLLPSLVTAATLLASGPAAAQAIATSPPTASRSVDVRVGMQVGGSDVGDVSGPSTGVHASLGRRWSDLTLMAEYDYASVGDADGEAAMRSGRQSRLGAVARLALLTTGVDSAVGVDAWLEAGAGAERIAWQHGGVLYRPDVVLGFGIELDGKPGHGAGGRRRHFGPYVAMRAVLARAPATGEPAICEGPCTMATPPSRNDVALSFAFGMHWGR